MAFVERYVTASATGSGDGTSEASAWTITQAFANATAGQRVNVKKGSYATGGTITVTNAGTSASSIVYRGYKTTIGDLDPRGSAFVGRVNGGPLNVTDFPTIDIGISVLSWGKAFTVLRNLAFTGTRGSGSIDTGNVATFVMHRVSVANTGTGLGAIAVSSFGGYATDCDFSVVSSAGSTGAALTGNAMTLSNCRLSNANGYAIVGTTNTSLAVDDSIFLNSTGGIQFGGTPTARQVVRGCTFYNISGDCLNIPNTAATGVWIVEDCTVDTCGRFVNVTNASGLAVVRVNNRVRNATSADANVNEWPEITRITTDDGTSDFTNAAGGDFSLAAGKPGVGAATWPYRDVGAVQRQGAMSYATAG